MATTLVSPGGTTFDADDSIVPELLSKGYKEPSVSGNDLLEEAKNPATTEAKRDNTAPLDEKKYRQDIQTSDIDQGTNGSVRMVSPSGTIFEAHPDVVNELKAKGYEQASEVQNEAKQQESDNDKLDKYTKQFSDQDNFGSVATQKFLDSKLASTQNVHGREFIDPQAIAEGVKSGEISQEDADKLQSGASEDWLGALSDRGKYSDIPKTTRLMLLKGNVPESDYRIAADAIDKIQSGHPWAQMAGESAQPGNLALLGIAGPAEEGAIELTGLAGKGILKGAGRLVTRGLVDTTLFNTPDLIQTAIVDKNPELAGENLLHDVLINTGMHVFGAAVGKTIDLLKAKNLADVGANVLTHMSGISDIDTAYADKLRGLGMSDEDINSFAPESDTSGRMKKSDFDKLREKYLGDQLDQTISQKGNNIFKLAKESGKEIGEITDQLEKLSEPGSNVAIQDLPEPTVSEGQLREQFTNNYLNEIYKDQKPELDKLVDKAKSFVSDWESKNPIIEPKSIEEQIAENPEVKTAKENLDKFTKIAEKNAKFKPVVEKAQEELDDAIAMAKEKTKVQEAKPIEKPNDVLKAEDFINRNKSFNDWKNNPLNIIHNEKVNKIFDNIKSGKMSKGEYIKSATKDTTVSPATSAIDYDRIAAKNPEVPKAEFTASNDNYNSRVDGTKLKEIILDAHENAVDPLEKSFYNKLWKATNAAMDENGKISPIKMKKLEAGIDNMIADKDPHNSLSGVKKQMASLIHDERLATNENIAVGAGDPELYSRLKIANEKFRVAKALGEGRKFINNSNATTLTPGVTHGGAGGIVSHAVHGAAAVTMVAGKAIKNVWTQKAEYALRSAIVRNLEQKNLVTAMLIKDKVRFSNVLKSIPTIINNVASKNVDRKAITKEINDFDGLKVLLGDEANGLSKAQQYKKVVELLSDPNNQQRQMEQSSQLGANLATQMQKQMTIMHQVFQGIFKPLSSPKPFQKVENITPTEQQLRDVSDAVRLVNDPAELLKDYQAGLINPSKVKLIETLFPASIAEMRQTIALESRGIHMDLQDRLMLSILMGNSVDPAAMFNLQIPSASQVQSAAGGNSTSKGSAIHNKNGSKQGATSFATESQKVRYGTK